MDFAPTFQMGHPIAFEAAATLGDAAAGRSRPRVLHQLRLRIGRHRAQDRDRLSSRPRRGRAHPPDRPRARLSRRRLRRHLGRRHLGQPQVLRQPAARRRSSAAHPRSREERLHPRPAELGRASRRRARADRGAARRLDHRRRHRRAGRRLDRRAGAAQGLSREAAPDLRQARHPADLRRGDHRLRAARRRLRHRVFRRHCPT